MYIYEYNTSDWTFYLLQYFDGWYLFLITAFFLEGIYGTNLWHNKDESLCCVQVSTIARFNCSIHVIFSLLILLFITHHKFSLLHKLLRGPHWRNERKMPRYVWNSCENGALNEVWNIFLCHCYIHVCRRWQRNITASDLSIEILSVVNCTTPSQERFPIECWIALYSSKRSIFVRVFQTYDRYCRLRTSTTCILSEPDRLSHSHTMQLLKYSVL